MSEKDLNAVAESISHLNRSSSRVSNLIQKYEFVKDIQIPKFKGKFKNGDIANTLPNNIETSCCRKELKNADKISTIGSDLQLRKTNEWNMRSTKIISSGEIESKNKSNITEEIYTNNLVSEIRDSHERHLTSTVSVNDLCDIISAPASEKIPGSNLQNISSCIIKKNKTKNSLDYYEYIQKKNNLEKMDNTKVDSLDDIQMAPALKDVELSVNEKGDNDKQPPMNAAMSNVGDESEIKYNNHEVAPQQNNVTKKLSKIVSEIKNTELGYILDLEIIIFQYKPYLESEIAEHLGSLLEYVEELYNLQSNFYEQIKESECDVEKTMHIFLNSNRLFNLYVLFIQNCLQRDYILKKYEQILKKKQEQLKDYFGLSEYLLKPVQRLGRYILFLENINNILKKNNIHMDSAAKALKLVKKIMALGNSEVAIRSILDTPFKNNEYGNYIMSDNFEMTHPKRMDLTVFLFTKVIAFTESQQLVNRFLYWKGIKISNLGVTFTKDNALHLTDHTKLPDKKKPFKAVYILNAGSKRLKDAWANKIDHILWKQFRKQKAIHVTNHQIKTQPTNCNMEMKKSDIPHTSHFDDRIESTQRDTDKIENILNELMETELKYILDMEIIVLEYKSFIHEKYPEHVEQLFGNIEDIYFKHLELYCQLKNYRNDIQKIIQLFINSESLFKLYPKYFKTQTETKIIMSKLKDILQERRKLQKDQFSLAEYLLRPLQRLGRYLYIIEQITRYLDVTQKPISEAKRALNIVKKNISLETDEFDFESFISSPFKPEDYGTYIVSGQFVLTDEDIELVVFLFSKVIIMATNNEGESNTFIYFDNIKINDLGFPFSDDSTFRLTDSSKLFQMNLHRGIYNLEARSRSIKCLFETKIETILWQQLWKDARRRGSIYQDEITNITIYNKNMLVSIECFPTDIQIKGRFLKMENFKITKTGQKPEHLTMFLLEDMLIFTKLLNNTYYYRDSYRFDQLLLIEKGNTTLRFKTNDNLIVEIEVSGVRYD